MGTYAAGTRFTIVCKLKGQSVDGNSLWYWTSDKRWVAARYVANVDRVPTYCVG